MVERWLPVAGYEGLYRVSDTGRVQTLHHGAPRDLSLRPDQCGYRGVVLYRDGAGKAVRVHRLVCFAFHGPAPSGQHCDVAHLDGDTANNSVANLAWVTKAENLMHRRLHGTVRLGEDHPNAKLKWADVHWIREHGPSKAVRIVDMARKYGVTPRCIREVLERKTWV